MDELEKFKPGNEDMLLSPEEKMEKDLQEFMVNNNEAVNHELCKIETSASIVGRLLRLSYTEANALAKFSPEVDPSTGEALSTIARINNVLMQNRALGWYAIHDPLTSSVLIAVTDPWPEVKKGYRRPQHS